jgi:exopolyphosphatase/guanosine-5'-triphosphate,3'-diphosphate pyrophosphatase
MSRSGSRLPFALSERQEYSFIMKRLASIDIGTNTVLLLIADISPDRSLNPLVYEQRVPRLGRGVDAFHRLHPDSMRRVIEVLREYSALIEEYKPQHTTVFGTSAVRDATNAHEFAAIIRAETGFNLEILSGNDEALWTFRGAMSGLSEFTGATVVDIGGGSTEITIGTPQAIINSTSLNIGSVRLTERLLKNDPPDPQQVASLRTTVREALTAMAWSSLRDSILVAVAGTATTLALIDQGLSNFNRTAVSGYRLSRQSIAMLSHNLSQTSSQDIRKMGDFLEGRNDIIAAGAIILDEMMTVFGFTEVIVSERGVRYGIVLRDAERWEI